MTALISKHRLLLLISLITLGVFSVDAFAQNVPRPKKRGRTYKVRIDSAPQQAAIYLDDEKYGIVGYTPWEGKLQKGDWRVILKKDGYELATRDIQIRRTRRVQETFVPLVKKDDPAKIDVRPDGDKNAFGAEVWVDGQSQGKIPVILTVDDGRHLLEVKKDGFQVFTQWVEVKEGERVTVNPVLKAEHIERKGRILVEADVPGATVYIDGNKHADLTPTILTDVIEGMHVIKVVKEPALPWTQTVEVKADTTVKVSAELKATIGGPVGSVRVLANIEGARVFLDGNEIGSVPQDIKDIKPGDHVIEVKAEGFQPFEKRIKVNAGTAEVLKATLRRRVAKDAGTIKVVSPITAALVSIDGERIGTAPQEKEVAAGKHFVVVEKNGYKRFEQEVEVVAGKTLTVPADLKAVGELRVLSTPDGADVVINGEVVGRTPFNTGDLEVGEHVVTLRLPNHVEYQERINISSDKRTIVTSTLVPIDTGPSPEDLEREQRGLTSFGARALPRLRSTLDFAAGYPYYLDGQMTVGAGSIAGKVPFDAGVIIRSFLSRTEFGVKTRFTFIDKQPFSMAGFSQIGGGATLFDDSGRNTFFFDTGLLVSLTAPGNITVTGRAYINFWSDRHCLAEAPAPGSAEAEAEIDICTLGDGDEVDDDPRKTKMEVLEDTGLADADLRERDVNVRFMFSIIGELAFRQRWSVWGLIEGAPFQDERAAFSPYFNGAFPKFLSGDRVVYLRAGLTYKF